MVDHSEKLAVALERLLDAYILSQHAHSREGHCNIIEELTSVKETRAALTAYRQESGGANHIGAAELTVGQFVYRRLEKLMDAKGDSPEGRELDYLADLVGNVEEYGARGDEDGEMFARHWSAPTPIRPQGEDEGVATGLICEDCGGRFASLNDGLCGMCSLEHLEGMEFDRDRE
jgi:hypothetical protein